MMVYPVCPVYSVYPVYPVYPVFSVYYASRKGIGSRVSGLGVEKEFF
jgi:hypothetical protein